MRTRKKHLILPSNALPVSECARFRRDLNPMKLHCLGDKPTISLSSTSPVCFEPTQASCIYIIFGKESPSSTAHFIKNHLILRPPLASLHGTLDSPSTFFLLLIRHGDLPTPAHAASLLSMFLLYPFQK